MRSRSRRLALSYFDHPPLSFWIPGVLARDAHGVRFVDAEAERSRQQQPERGRACDERADRAGRVYGIAPVHPGPRSATPGFAPVTFVSRTTATPFTHTSMTPVLT